MNAKTPNTLIGIGLMLIAMAVLPGIDVIAKHMGANGTPVLMIVWARLTFGAVLTLPFALPHAGLNGLLPKRPLILGLRATLLIAATFFFFWSLHFLPIADALAIFFVQPLVVTALSPLILGEHVGPRRWAAVAVGFIGTLIIIRPGFGTLNPGAILALAAGTSLALYMLLTRRIAGEQKAIVTTFHTNLLGGVITSVLVPFVWVTPTPTDWLLFVALATIANIGHNFIVRAYDHAEASLLAPLAYTEMITSTLMGLIFFGDFPDRWTFLGVAILISCAIYISVRERNQPQRPLP
ncbi:MAG: DMT family transporter [Candidatus Saccharibacteria bacterium]|nr:DMT family transporter [Pseudorhodobacter sp.]